MKKLLLTVVATLLTSTAFAQAAAGAAAGTVGSKEEVSGQKSMSDQKAGDKAQMKVDAKKGMASTPSANAGTPAMMAMDTNGDGMISRREYDNYHSAMWKSMKHSKGMVSQADMNTAAKGGPN